MKALCFFAASVLVSSFFGVATVDTKADPREKLDTAISEATRLLEGKEYLSFLKSFLSPDDLKKITETNTLEEFAKQFGENKAPRLLKVLSAIKDVKPTIEADGKKATYELKDRMDGKKNISFKKIDKFWYLQN